MTKQNDRLFLAKEASVTNVLTDLDLSYLARYEQIASGVEQVVYLLKSHASKSKAKRLYGYIKCADDSDKLSAELFLYALCKLSDSHIAVKSVAANTEALALVLMLYIELKRPYKARVDVIGLCVMSVVVKTVNDYTALIKQLPLFQVNTYCVLADIALREGRLVSDYHIYSLLCRLVYQTRGQLEASADLSYLFIFVTRDQTVAGLLPTSNGS